MMRSVLTIGIWVVSFVALMLGGLIAVAFILMATSLDPVQMINAGVEPWTDALQAGGAFVGLFATTALSLVLWHTTRFKSAGLILTALDVAGVTWACMKVYGEYL